LPIRVNSVPFQWQPDPFDINTKAFFLDPSFWVVVVVVVWGGCLFDGFVGMDGRIQCDRRGAGEEPDMSCDIRAGTAIFGIVDPLPFRPMDVR
jgi:hypothetical protein